MFRRTRSGQSGRRACTTIAGMRQGSRARFAFPWMAVCLWAVLLAAGARAGTDTMPSRLEDGEFWGIVQGFSERPGSFPSDNLLSNERGLQSIIPELTRRVPAGGVYLGVGPEQ